MNRSEPAARCYAEALLLLAKEGNRLEPVLDDLRGVMGVFHADRKVWALFTSPRVTPDRKEAIVRKAFEGRVGREVLGLLLVLVRKGREPILDNVLGQFERFRDVEEKRIHVHLRSAHDLDPEVRKAIEETVAAASGKTVVVHEEREPALVGGLVVRVGDVVVDASIRSRLAALRRRLVGER